MPQKRVQAVGASEASVAVTVGAGATGNAAAAEPSVEELMSTLKYLDTECGHGDRSQFCAQFPRFRNGNLITKNNGLGLLKLEGRVAAIGPAPPGKWAEPTACTRGP